MLSLIKKEIQSLANPEQAKNLQRFFKTGKGQYGEGDVFFGLNSQQIKDVAKKFYETDLGNIQELINSKIHEERMCALRILIQQYKKAKKNPLQRRRIFEFYLKNSKKINNWDLVDVSAPNIVGDFLEREDSGILRQLAISENLWEKRIAIVSTYTFIKKRKFGETLAISEILMNDEHDLIHKAVGWMLREVGKRNMEVLEIFLATRYKKMPRTMLRYAIEKFPEEKRKAYLKGEI
ncbi:MAG: DNA alkylation repair protein [Nanoarchaeota archaeon]|nr:DNA alkylation repair protein [Nanoarchaeota archaeon]